MADENRPPNRIGVVGQPTTPQSGQPGTQRGVPGAVQPPVPSPEEIARVMAEQQRVQQQQVAEARARQEELSKRHVPGQAVSSMPIQPRVAQAQPQAAQAPAPQPQPQAAPTPQPSQAQPTGHVVMTHGQDSAVPSPVPGMTAEQVLAGFPNPPGQPQQPAAPQPQQQRAPAQQPRQGGNQFAQFSEPPEVQKIVVPWFPIRSKGVDVELEDSIIKAVPSDGIAGEGDAGAKVVLALFSEILALRERVQQLESGNAGGMSQEVVQFVQQLGQRIYNLEATLYEQRNAMQSRARGVKEQIQLLMAQGKSPEEVLAALQSQADTAAELASAGGPVAQPSHTPAEAQDDAKENMASQAAGATPEGNPS